MKMSLVCETCWLYRNAQLSLIFVWDMQLAALWISFDLGRKCMRTEEELGEATAGLLCVCLWCLCSCSSTAWDIYFLFPLLLLPFSCFSPCHILPCTAHLWELFFLLSVLTLLCVIKHLEHFQPDDCRVLQWNPLEICWVGCSEGVGLYEP